MLPKNYTIQTRHLGDAFSVGAIIIPLTLNGREMYITHVRFTHRRRGDRHDRKIVNRILNERSAKHLESDLDDIRDWYQRDNAKGLIDNLVADEKTWAVIGLCGDIGFLTASYQTAATLKKAVVWAASEMARNARKGSEEAVCARAGALWNIIDSTTTAIALLGQNDSETVLKLRQKRINAAAGLLRLVTSRCLEPIPSSTEEREARILNRTEILAKEALNNNAAQGTEKRADTSTHAT